MIKKNNINHAVILAAGRGIRMRPLTNKIPKAMAPLGGDTLISNGIKKIKKHIKNVYITVGHKKSMLASHVIENDVSGVINTNNKGNAWWIFNSLLSYLDKPIFVLTCDNVVEMDFKKIIKEYYILGKPHCMLVPTDPVKGLEGDYIFYDEKNLVTKLSRKVKSNLYCSGIQILNIKKIVNDIKACDDFKQVWNQLIKQKKIYCALSKPYSWYSVDNTEHLKKVNSK